MADVARFREKVKDFGRQAMLQLPAMMPEEAVADISDAAERQSFIATFCDTLDRLRGILEEECLAIRENRLPVLDDLARSKEGLLLHMQKLMQQMIDAGVSLRDAPDPADIERRWHLFDQARHRNMAALDALQGAIRQVVGLAIRALAAESSEGLYARSGLSVRPTEISPAGVNIDF